MSFSRSYLYETQQIIENLDFEEIEIIAKILREIKKNKGRLFIIGNGGSLATASHAVSDFRKIVKIESYNPGDFGAELSARINDEGIENSLTGCLLSSDIRKEDALMILSVGGSDIKRNISINIAAAANLAKEIGCTIIGIIGRDGGYVAKIANACVIIPPIYENHITPHTEEIASVILHLLVSHPLLKTNETKWESLNETKN